MPFSHPPPFGAPVISHESLLLDRQDTFASACLDAARHRFGRALFRLPTSKSELNGRAFPLLMPWDALGSIRTTPDVLACFWMMALLSLAKLFVQKRTLISIILSPWAASVSGSRATSSSSPSHSPKSIKTRCSASPKALVGLKYKYPGFISASLCRPPTSPTLIGPHAPKIQPLPNTACTDRGNRKSWYRNLVPDAAHDFL